MNYKVLFCLLFCFISQNICSQNNCECPVFSGLENGFQKDTTVTQKKIELLEKANTTDCKFELLANEFSSQIQENEFYKALTSLSNLENLVIELECKELFRLKLLSHKTTYYRAINDLEELSDVAFKTLQLAQKLDDSKKTIEAIQQIVFVFTRLNEDKKNWSYILKAKDLIDKINLSKENVSNLIWLATEYETKFTLTQRKSLIDSAFIYSKKAKSIALKNIMTDKLSEVYKILEACSYHQKDYNSAVKYIDSSIYYAKKNKSYLKLGPLYIYKSWDLLELKKNLEVEKNLDSAQKYNQTKGGARVAFFHELSSIYESIGKQNKALLNYKQYAKLKDSIINLKTLEKVNDIEQKYHKVANENKIVALQKTKQFYLFLVLVSVLIICSVSLFYRQHLLKNKQKNLIIEQRLQKARINPHFFFNSMASLQNLSLKENSPNTSRYISKFAKIMRQTLENSYNDLINIKDEIVFLKHYIEVQKLRFPNAFEYFFKVDEKLDIDALKILSMILQPFVENAIEHGFRNINYKGKLEISFTEHKNDIKILIVDNGKGLIPNKDAKTYKSRAIQITQDRLHLFNIQNKTNANFEKEELKKGFKVSIIFPKLY